MFTLTSNAAHYTYVYFFFFNDTATTEIYTLSLHDALPIYRRLGHRGACRVVHAGLRSLRRAGGRGPHRLPAGAVGPRAVRLRRRAAAPDHRSRAGRPRRSPGRAAGAPPAERPAPTRQRDRRAPPVRLPGALLRRRPLPARQQRQVLRVPAGSADRPAPAGGAHGR